MRNEIFVPQEFEIELKNDKKSSKFGIIRNSNLQLQNSGLKTWEVENKRCLNCEHNEEWIPEYKKARIQEFGIGTVIILALGIGV